MAKRRTFSTSNLSFLDVMSCGFGAVVLIFLIIKHDISNQQNEQHNDLRAEVDLLEDDVRAAEAFRVKAKNTLSSLDQERAKAEGLARRINNDIEAVRTRLAQLSPNDEAAIEAIKLKLSQLQEQKQQLEEQIAEGNDARQFSGQGNRQYLTGLKLGGRRILIMLDASASMLDETIINIIRLRNMPHQQRLGAEKWQRAIRTVEWIMAKFPIDSQFQIYVFNDKTRSVIDASTGRWLQVSDRKVLEQTISSLKTIAPEKGTNLELAFHTMAELPQLPDNVFLITDGLPTMGMRATKGNTISGAERERLFNRAIGVLPKGIPVNVILAPMEGDPLAAGAFWQMAIQTQGSFMSPSKDWP